MPDFENNKPNTDDAGEEIIIKNKKTSLKQKFFALKDRIDRFFENPTKRLIFIICLGFVVIVAFGLGLYFMTKDATPANSDKNSKTTTAVEEIPLFDAPLDGVKVEEATSKKHPLAIMIENHPQARPQAGLDKASIVYEAIAEGGITRFMALFGTNEADKVGPIRSSRPYYLDWLEGYSAFYAHVGGNVDALDQIKADSIYDLDQFIYPTPYWRDTSLSVSREHTMFSSTIALRQQASKNQYPETNDCTLYTFADNPKNDPLLTAAIGITIDFSSPSSLVKFQSHATNT